MPLGLKRIPVLGVLVPRKRFGRDAFRHYGLGAVAVSSAWRI